LGRAIHEGEDGGRCRREAVDFDSCRTCGEQGKPQCSGQKEKSRSGIVRAKKAEEDSQYDPKGEGATPQLQPEAGGIRISGDEFPKKIQGGRGEGL
jgi:hypothetical protein